ncbi:MAG: hypothetical protein ACOYLO_00025 [Ferruginibacter sp.]
MKNEKRKDLSAKLLNDSLDIELKLNHSLLAAAKEYAVFKRKRKHVQGDEAEISPVLGALQFFTKAVMDANDVYAAEYRSLFEGLITGNMPAPASSMTLINAYTDGHIEARDAAYELAKVILKLDAE